MSRLTFLSALQTAALWLSSRHGTYSDTLIGGSLSDGTSRGKGIGGNLGVKGLRERAVQFRMFSLSGSGCKLFPFLFPCLLFFICPWHLKCARPRSSIFTVRLFEQQQRFLLLPSLFLQVSLFLCSYFICANLCDDYKTNPQ